MKTPFGPLRRLAAAALGALVWIAAVQAADIERGEEIFRKALGYTVQIKSSVSMPFAGDAKGSDDGLRQVVASSALDLMEMGFAKDLLGGPKGQLGPLPKDVKIP